MSRTLVFHGTLIHCPAIGEFEIIEDGLLVVAADKGIITHLGRNIPRSEVSTHLKDVFGVLEEECEIIFLASSSSSSSTQRQQQGQQFLIPGFVDTHNHAPQWAQRGLGQGMHILDWLSEITFPNEARFSEVAYARRVYGACVKGMLKQGVTTAAYYGSMHADASMALMDVCVERGQRALVGKCNMDRNAPEYYRDASAEESLMETRRCVQYTRDRGAGLVDYVLTPRFAITCSEALLRGLGEIAAEKEGEGLMRIQTHFNEAEQEMSFTRSLFPQFANEVDLYESFGLLTRRTILAHCCHMSEYELGRLRDLGCGVAHCPASNMTVGGGFMAAPVREFLRRGVKVGLGTDSGGGFSSSVLDAMRLAIVASNAKEVETKGRDKGLSVQEVFCMATLGGAQVCGLGDKVGCFEVGREFDAVVVDAGREEEDGDEGVMTMLEERDDWKTVFEKFVMTGDDRNIGRVYVRGQRVK